MRKIMIVEDDPAIREELALLLENEGYQALAVTDFGDVPGQAGTFGPDLVLLDLGLPDARAGRFLPVRRASETMPGPHRGGDQPELGGGRAAGAQSGRRRLHHQAVQHPHSACQDQGGAAPQRRSVGAGHPGGWGSAAQPVQGDRVGKWTDRGAHPERAEDPGPPDGPRRGDRVPGRPDRGAVGQQDLYR